MIKNKTEFDSVIIGGGIFGLYSALYLAKNGQRVALLEKEKGVFQRASTVNQARVHNGYHYPRSVETALKTTEYYQRFCQDFSKSLLKPFKQIYAISSKNSKVSSSDYIKFCKSLNLPLNKINPSEYFNSKTVAAAFEAKEECFDFEKIKNILLEKIKSTPNINIYCNTYITKSEILNSKYNLSVHGFSGNIIARNVINTTYANINEINKIFGLPEYKLKYELCELMLCDVDGLPKKTGLTVMDGMFFSLMPFGNGNKYSLSSVKHTPFNKSLKAPQNSKCIDLQKMNHINFKTIAWTEAKSVAKRYLKSSINLRYSHSILEIKPILLESEKDDSRPTIITVHRKDPYFISVLAGKISTIYDLDASLKCLI